MPGQTGDFWVLVGTYTNGSSKGIYVYRMDSDTGALHAHGHVPAVDPTFLAVHPGGDRVYAVGTAKFDDRPSGSVVAYAFDRTAGELTELNVRSSHGASSCHLTVDATGRFVLVANYSGGSIAVLPIGEDGALGEAVDVHMHAGSSVNPARQEGPHPHSIHVDPSNRYVFVPDLGIDKVVAYAFNERSGKLTPREAASVAIRPGAGPRHLAFHPGGLFAYVINELDSTVTALRYDQEGGRFDTIQTVGTLPPDFTGNSTCAEVVVHPSGGFLYGSNRGHDSIAIFRIDGDSGLLTAIGHESTQGKTPRNFALDPTGRYLLAENQDSHTIVTFAADPSSGALRATGHVTEVPSPVCVRMIPC